MAVLAALLFVLGAVFLVWAWMTEAYEVMWLGFDSTFLIGNAAVFFVLSLMFKMKKRWLKRAIMAQQWMGGGCGSDCGCSSGSGGGCGSDCGCSAGGGCSTEGCAPGGCGENGCGPECTPEGCGKEGCCKA